MEDEPVIRAELLAPYEHPYRTSLPKLWGIPAVRRAAIVGAALPVAIVAIGFVLGVPLLASLLLLALPIMMFAGALGLMYSGLGAVAIARRSRTWDARSELGTVRARRPHAGDADARLVHAEYAVTVEDTGELFVWHYLPLAVDAPAPPAMVEVPGRPRWAADVVERLALDTTDTARAAEQLVAAQARAAELELAARQDAEGALARREARDELAAETAAAALPLRHLTGQSGRRSR